MPRPSGAERPGGFAGIRDGSDTGSVTRTGWHRRANLVVLGYLVLAAVTVPVGGGGERGRWLAVHLLLLGAATNAIVTWTEHFAVALLRAPGPDRRRSAARLITLNVSIVGVLTGVALAVPLLTVVAATLLAVVLVAHTVALWRSSRRALQGRFAGTVRYYQAAGLAVLAGIALGVTLALHPLSDARAEALRAAHVHANLLGWVTLTVLGTLFTLWPTALRTRMVDGVMRSAGRALPLLSAGLAIAVIAFTVLAVSGQPAGGPGRPAGPAGAGLRLDPAERWAAVAGLLVYLAGVTEALRPFAATWRRKPAREAGPVSMAAATGWLVVALVLDLLAVAVVPDLDGYDRVLDALVPVLLVGFVVQILLGALTFLIPVILGGGPARVRAANRRLGRWWPARVVAVNLGVLLIGAPLPAALAARWPTLAGRWAVPGWLPAAGWGLVLAAVAGFLGLSLRTIAAPPSGSPAGVGPGAPAAAGIEISRRDRGPE